MKPKSIVLLSSLLFLTFKTKRSTAQNPDPPNIIFFLVDDWGHYDIDRCEPKDIHTPNINRLAKEGVFLENYYVTPLCTPSRASLMTGMYDYRTGLQHYVMAGPQPSGLPLNITIMPQYLNKLGYISRIIGKWHLGFHRREYTPTFRGFKSHYGFWSGNNDHFTHSTTISIDASIVSNLTSNYERTPLHPGRRDMDIVTGNEMKYLCDLYNTEALNIIKNHDQTNPLFLYMAEHGVHRGNNLKEMTSPNKYAKYFKHIRHRERQQYAGALACIDASLGKIVAALAEQHMLENTIIVVSSDNGGPLKNGFFSNGASNYPYFGNKGSPFEGGVKVTGFVWSPLIVNNRRTYRGLMHVTDWLPTLYSAAGGKVSDLGDIDGFDMWRAINTGETSPRQEIVLHLDPVFNITGLRWKNYKLVTGVASMYEHGNIGDRIAPENETAPTDDRCWPLESYSVDVTIDQFYQVHPELARMPYARCDPPTIPLMTTTSANPCTKKDQMCLFKLDDDPYETRNIANEEKEIVDYILKRLRYHQARAVPVNFPPCDYNASPYFHNGYWVPFREEEYLYSSPSNTSCTR